MKPKPRHRGRDLFSCMNPTAVLVMGICEDITVLDHRETIAKGSPEQVRNDPKVIEANLGE